MTDGQSPENLGKLENQTTISINSRSQDIVEEPRILDAMKDQDAERYIRYGTNEVAVLFKVSDLVRKAKDIFADIAGKGLGCLTRSSQEALKKLVDAHVTYRPIVVANRPGWVGNDFVLGDGRIVGPPDACQNVLVSFFGDKKFFSKGSLASWQQALSSVKDQPFLLFALAVGFTGPLVRLIPGSDTNPFVEFVGRPQSGKSSLGTLAMSIFAGDSNLIYGGGASWSVTLNALSEIGIKHNDLPLFLDEANLAESNEARVAGFFNSAIFKLAEGTEKARFGQSGCTDHFNVAVISTSNIPLRDLLRADSSVTEAARSRVISVSLDENEIGAFDHLPEGFETSRQAIEALRAAVNESYGVAGYEFVQKLAQYQREKKDKLDAIISKGLEEYMRRSAEFGSPPRIQKQFAMIAVAGRLAKGFKVIPEEWGSAFLAVLEVHKRVAEWEKRNRSLTPLERVLGYIEKCKSDLLSKKKLAQISKEEFAGAAGVILTVKGGRCLLIAQDRFRQEFHDSLQLLRRLRDSGDLKTEGEDMLVVKPPSAFRHLGRVHCIKLPT